MMIQILANIVSHCFSSDACMQPCTAHGASKVQLEDTRSQMDVPFWRRKKERRRAMGELQNKGMFVCLDNVTFGVKDIFKSFSKLGKSLNIYF